MSMVSIKNFISPFTNTVHLVTIILITVLFALFRLQGGGVSANFSNTRQPIEEQIQIPDLPETASSDEAGPSTIEDFIKPRAKSPSAPSKADKIADSGTIQISEEDDDLLKQMIGQKPLEEKPAIPAANNKKNPAGGLAEIEKSLGMR